MRARPPNRQCLSDSVHQSLESSRCTAAKDMPPTGTKMDLDGMWFSRVKFACRVITHRENVVYAAKLFVDRPGLFGQVITVVDAPSGHVPGLLKMFSSFKIEFEIPKRCTHNGRR